MRGNIVVCGKDASYSEALITYLTLSKKNQFQYIWSPNLDEINDSKYDLCLIDEETYKVMVFNDNWNKEMAYILLGEATTTYDLETIPIIFKYQKAADIEELLIKHFIELTTKEAINGHRAKTHIIGCYSPSGGSGNTTIAQIISQIMSRQGKKVFFMSFDSFPIYDEGYCSSQESDLTDYMIHLMTKTNWLMGLEKMKCVDDLSNVHYFKPGPSENDQHEFDQTLWLKWIAYMKDHSDYDCIILDMVTRDVQKNMKIMAMCTSTIYTVRNDYYGHLKWQKYSEDLLRLGRQHLLENGLVVLNSLLPNSGGDEMNFNCHLDYDENLYTMLDGINRSINSQCRTYKSLEVLLCGLN